VEEELAPVVAEVIVDPEQEQFVLEPDIVMNVEGPEQELIHAQWETALEEIGWAFFKWNSAECLSC